MKGSKGIFGITGNFYYILVSQKAYRILMNYGFEFVICVDGQKPIEKSNTAIILNHIRLMTNLLGIKVYFVKQPNRAFQRNA